MVVYKKINVTKESCDMTFDIVCILFTLKKWKYADDHISTQLHNLHISQQATSN